MNNIVCVYHSPCADGFTSAWAVWKRFGHHYATYVEGHYGNVLPLETFEGKHVIFVDFSYKLPDMEKIGAVARSVLVLDHHKTAEEELKPFTAWKACMYWESHLADADTYADAHWHNRFGVHFDMEHSGAHMAWTYFHPGKPIPWIVKYVQDRDLWKHELLGTKEVSAVIFSHPQTFGVWDDLAMRLEDSIGLEHIVAEGRAILRKQSKDTADLIKATQRRMMIDGYEVPVANLPYTMASDAGNIMAVGEPFAATYFDAPDGRHFSLRSSEYGIDVSNVAKGYGGGGHVHAAGFLKPLGWEGETV